jgi:porphobilinogen synthase
MYFENFRAGGVNMFPLTRFRRNRKACWVRDILAESNLTVNDLIWPVFIKAGEDQKEVISSLPGVSRYNVKELLLELQDARSLGIKAIALFPAIDNSLKTEDGRESYNPNNLVCSAIKKIKDKFPDLGVICDVALDPYTTHGHDGLICSKSNYVDNDKTIEILVKQALVQAEAGCDVVAPSDMMDGRILKIREALEKNNYKNTNILAYSAKYASNFYGPFRDAVCSAGNLGKSDKKNYQMDFRNAKEAMLEIQADIDEGADIIMVKPGMPYLDIIKQASMNFDVPVFAYQVSGEYAMLKFAALNNCFDFNQVLIESLYGFKRAGASAIFSYGAIEVAKYLQDNT